MNVDDLQEHWQRAYRNSENELSWHQSSPEPSLSLVTEAAASHASAIIDIGGGASHLVDHLVQRGYSNVTVLDLSATAFAQAQARLGERAADVTWIVADIADWDAPANRYDVWHDRATFHFMVSDDARSAYLARLKRALVPGGYAIIATFDLNGPEKCSGLPVLRYDPPALGRTLGPDYTLITSAPHCHRTPWGVEQPFQFSVFRRQPESA